MHSHHGMPFFRHRKGFKQSQLKIEDSLGQIKSKVSLDCVTEEDAGIYECVISNGHEKITAATEVTIASRLPG